MLEIVIEVCKSVGVVLATVGLLFGVVLVGLGVKEKYLRTKQRWAK